jgi:hypothetical protein
MDPLDELSNVLVPVKSDQLTGPILQATPLLGIDVWQEAFDSFDVLADAETNAGLPLEEQQYLSDLRVDRYLYDTLAREFHLLDVWLRRSPAQPEAARVTAFLQRRQQFGARSWIDQQEKLYLWAQKNERDDFASSILGWRLLCQELAASLLAATDPALAGFTRILSAKSPANMGAPVSRRCPGAADPRMGGGYKTRDV